MKYFDDLIFEITNKNLGAQINQTNVSIIVYADDIILLSSVDAHLQKMLDICGTYSNLWRIKFNAAKSSLMEFGTQFFNNSHFYIDNTLVPKVDHIKYLGVKIDKHLNFKDSSIEKFKNVQRSVFSLSFLGLKTTCYFT